MVAVASRAAMMGAETHDAWVEVFAAVIKPPPDPKRAACPNCGHFSVQFRYLADERSRVGLCARLLSPREQEVARLFSEGSKIAQIAASLYISPATVRGHLQRIYWKLGRAADRRMLQS